MIFWKRNEMTEIHVTENQDREVSPAYEDAVRSGIFSQESLCWSLLFTSLPECFGEHTWLLSICF